MTASYETTREIEIELNGLRYRGRYRVMAGTVIAYYETEIKFAEYGIASVAGPVLGLPLVVSPVLLLTFAGSALPVTSRAWAASPPAPRPRMKQPTPTRKR